MSQSIPVTPQAPKGASNTTKVVVATTVALAFISFYGTAASPVPVWHEISLAGSTLSESTYPVTGTYPDWGQGATASSTKTLLTNVSQLSSTTPVFQYYAYKAAYTDSSGNQYMMIPDGANVLPTGAVLTAQPLATSTGLSANDADTVVEVVINLLVGASRGGGNNTTLQGVSDSVNDSVSLRLTTPPNYVPAGTTATGYGPCQ